VERSYWRKLDREFLKNGVGYRDKSDRIIYFFKSSYDEGLLLVLLHVTADHLLGKTRF